MRIPAKIFLIALSIGVSFFTVSAQDAAVSFKFDESGRPDAGCGEYSRLLDFMVEIMKRREDDRGLIVVYRGNGTPERFGNLSGYVAGVRRFLDSHGVPASKIDVTLAEGKNFFDQEFWVIPKNVAPPRFTEAKHRWEDLKSKYHFSTSCPRCEPSYPELTDFQPNFEEFAELIRTNAGLKGLVTVGSSFDAKYVRKELARLRLPRNRFEIKIIPPTKDDDGYSVDLFILPTPSNRTTKTT